MRLFVALLPPPEVVADLATAVDAVRARAPGLRWVPPERWHLTLAFLGEVGPERLPDLTEQLSRAAARHRAPRLRLAGAGRFGSAVLWAGVRGDVDGLVSLAASVAGAARAAGVPLEERPLRPHLTLARSRGDADLPALVALLDPLLAAALDPAHDLVPRPVWTAAQVHLVRSRLTPAPSYEVLTSAALGGPRPG